MKALIERYFGVREQGSSISVELVAGAVTFMTMSYIIFLQPLILAGALFNHPTGMDIGALMTGVCLASAAGSILMGLWANYPIALAPGMGENFFFLSAVTACAAAGAKVPWQAALAIVFVSGLLFLLVSAANLRQIILGAISADARYAIAGGIGLFIAYLGLRNGGVVTVVNGYPALGDLRSITVLIFAVGLFATAAARALKFRGAILLGISVALLAAMVCRKVQWQGLCAAPPDISPLFGQMDFAALFSNLHVLLPYVAIFLFMDVFDTLGTLVGVGTQAGFMKDGQLPRIGRVMASDSIGTTFGALCGHSTVTAYIESATGVEYGGRTGLTAISAGLCFLLALFFYPLVKMVGAYPDPGLNPITAPALVVVGTMMMSNLPKIHWENCSESVPAFLIMAGIPFTGSIADGLALGFIAYPIIKLLSGRRREIGWLTYALGAVLLFYLICVKATT